ncbi:hypothetical protein AB0E06_11970 [Streptomyces sp. NPDC048109]|uniref:hypothetical protein n=1 Tax=unclassified Streptomyces TaxID=2593676 RepID=UPI0033E0938F
MSPAPWHAPDPLSTGHVIGTVRTLMRTEGLNVSLTAIARACGTSRNFLYANWKSVSALHLRALTVELAQTFAAANRTHPSDGTVRGITEHLVQAVRLVRRHPTTAAVARSSRAAMATAHTVTEGPLVRVATEHLSDLLHPLAPYGGVQGSPVLYSRPWKILWVARPAALCPEAVGDPDWEDRLDGGFTHLVRDLLAPWAATSE